MGKSIFIVLIVVLIGSAILGGCATPAPAPSSAPAPAPAPAPVKPIELKFVYHSTPANPITVDGLEVWVKAVHEATSGKVKITSYPSESLVKAADTYDAVRTGIADIGWAFEGLFPGRFLATEVIQLPCLAPGINGENTSLVLMDLYNSTPALQKEYPDVKVLQINSQDPANIGTTKKPVRQLEDLKGMKLRVTGTYATKFMSVIGAVPINMGPGELYENLQKGVIDGYAYSFEGTGARKLYEVAKYQTDAKWYVAPFFTIMNLNKWNSLPPDVQKAIGGVSGAKAAQYFGKAYDNGTTAGVKKCIEAGNEIITLPDSEFAKWQQAAKPVWDGWLADVKAKGIPGDQILDETLKLFKKYR